MISRSVTSPATLGTRANWFSVVVAPVWLKQHPAAAVLLLVLALALTTAAIAYAPWLASCVLAVSLAFGWCWWLDQTERGD